MVHLIELGAFEYNVDVLPGIRISSFIYDTKKGTIVLYFVGDLSEKELTATLKTKLPRYMLPNKIIRIDQMPLTANGKLDRIALKRSYEGQ